MKIMLLLGFAFMLAAGLAIAAQAAFALSARWARVIGGLTLIGVLLWGIGGLICLWRVIP